MDKYEEYSKSEYILNATTVDSTTLEGFSENTGSGSVVKEALTVGPVGPRIQQNIGATSGKSVVKIPITFGSSSNSIVSIEAELNGIYFTGTRPTVTFALVQQNSATPRRYGIYWDEFGPKLLSDKGTSGYDTVTLMSSNIIQVANGNLKFIINPIDLTIEGEVGGATGKLPLLIGGQYVLTVTNEHKTTETYSYYNHSLMYRELKLTIVWNVNGSLVRKVY